MTASSGHAARRYSPERGSARPHQPVLITVAEPGPRHRAAAPAGSVPAAFRLDDDTLTAILAIQSRVFVAQTRGWNGSGEG